MGPKRDLVGPGEVGERRTAVDDAARVPFASSRVLVVDTVVPRRAPARIFGAQGTVVGRAPRPEQERLRRGGRSHRSQK